MSAIHASALFRPACPVSAVARRALAESTKYSPVPSKGASEDEVKSARVYCSGLLQKYDAPSYTLQTFIPPASRDAYLSLRAFNVSISSIADTVRNPTVGAMRLQFWRDAVNSTFRGTPPKEPVAILLSRALDDLSARGGKMSKGWLLRIISAREQYLNNPPYPTLEALEAYAESTYSTLLYLTLSTLPLHSLAADHVASHVGKAAGIAAVLRGLPLIAFPQSEAHHSNTSTTPGTYTPATRQGAVTLPLDVMAAHGVQEEAVLRQGPAAPGLADAVFDVATRANDHLITAREMLRNLRAGQDVGHAFEHEGEEGHEYATGSRGGGAAETQISEVDRGFGAMMPAVATQLWLDRLQSVDFDVFRPELRRREWKLPWKSYWAYSRRKF
ncbi:MAG: hypothetical protein M1833_006865 [Piccolia ochrophora]|nr:MAG: hypothetical protein M1833_006865 [Piccolia ochrophora]